MELSDLLVETSEVTATYKGRDFKMQVFTEKLTPQYKAHLLALTTVADEVGESENAPQEVKDETSLMLSDLVDSWDVVLKGVPFPPTYENFAQLSYPLQACLLKKITGFLGDLANPSNGTN